MRRIFLNIISIISFAPFISEVSEEEVVENVRKLKQFDWFQVYLRDERYKNLIISNKKVRYTIGILKNKKLDDPSYNNTVRTKVSNRIEKEFSKVNAK